jgi:hypothetical protein
VEADIPTVGCAQDGQVGFQPAPSLPKTVKALILQGTASSLAYYSAHDEIGSGVLAPRGWSCFGSYGSAGSHLYVVPSDVGGEILDRPGKVSRGLAVVASTAIGDTSGRFTVAEIAARIFPRAKPFVERVMQEGLDDPNEFVFSPWQNDAIRRLSDFAVSYTTPARTQGLGTMLGLETGKYPISGLVLLLGDIDQSTNVFTDSVAIRLTPNHLYPSIIMAKIGSIAVRPGEGGNQDGGALGVVTAFYEALGRGDGVSASERVIPEKRDFGPLSASAMTQFYSRLSEPLRLIAVSQQNDGSIIARYRYREVMKKRCEGQALIRLQYRGSELLIGQIKANC